MSLGELSQLIQKNKEVLAKGFVESAILAPRYSREKVDNDEFIQRELHCLVDFIEKGVCESSEAFTNLYVGEKAKMAYVAGAQGSERNALLKDMVAKDQEVVQSILGARDEYLEPVNAFFGKLISIFESPPKYELNVLFIGDCLHLDVMAFLVPSSLMHGINIVPEIIADKNVSTSLPAIAELRDKPFDLIFYSPFSYEFHKPFMKLLLQNSMSLD